MSTQSGHAGWDIRRAGPDEAEHRLLLLPSGLCTTEFYADVMADPGMAEAGLGMVAVTLPGFGRTPPPKDLAMENYARLMGEFAAEAGCDVLVGHSLGANVAIEMVAAGVFAGPVVLLSPTFSSGDEATFIRMMDRLGRVPGVRTLLWAAMVKLLPRAMKSEFAPDRAEALAAAMGRNDPGFCRRIVRSYFAYLDRHGSLVARLCDSGASAWVVRGDRDDIGLTDEELRGLRACPRITMVTVPDAGHMALVEQPARIAEVIVEAAGAAPGRR
ncbi:alpha/beta fold hydrolase [Streptomyces sp. H39-C1]|uniref:alpha/beta fold hydrolase n=1 Tax=Streptomyces sp. H39-C1 TaxID=3004355 RepID=UPI0022B07E57|nr:alpha/beta hydrolase [Streptomyces sp. H39-C1]MCZ4095387.1 alpha/beta hydrolase [Streptomyces sp. H39-C1]